MGERNLNTPGKLSLALFFNLVSCKCGCSTVMGPVKLDHWLVFGKVPPPLNKHLRVLRNLLKHSFIYQTASPWRPTGRPSFLPWTSLWIRRPTCSRWPSPASGVSRLRQSCHFQTFRLGFACLLDTVGTPRSWPPPWCSRHLSFARTTVALFEDLSFFHQCCGHFSCDRRRRSLCSISANLVLYMT